MRCHADGRGWVTHAWESVDPDVLAASLNILHFHSGTAVDAYWHHLVTFDVVQYEKSRFRMKMFLARYGRQNVLQWDDVEVLEIRRYAEALSELLSEENETSRVTEE